eukprot:TRINITY_DN10144_c1_g1_i1.p1 TRINITY_DN10144_c1_g1~~TRINITY_DN10144_c1_g1_i1.p1  ORF type:complete len:758 (+),score=186.88 TRINITY_DN10144_c1_g1_i1:38-2275(+)
MLGKLLIGLSCTWAASAALPCTQAPLLGTPACNTSLPLGARAGYIVSQLTKTEKIGLFSNTAKSVPRLNIDSYQWWSEALHGVGKSPGVSFTPPTPCATSFPQVITTSASFNKSLYHSISTVISTEARAMNNVGHAGLSFWTPNINLIRDPRWGRGHETPGEDPVGTATYAAHFVPGIQEGEDPNHLKASACCKHYYAYDLENWGGVDRHHFNAVISMQDETDTYFPAFHSCVVNGRSKGIMCSYNAVNGTPSCANGRIMNGMARAKWGFDGYITSDCGAVQDINSAHHFADPLNTCKDALEAGMDSDCGSFLNNNLGKSMSANVTPESAVDAALQHLFEMEMRFGFYDPVSEQPYLNYSYKTMVNTPAHQELALEVAQQAMVLLKNDGTFPLSTDSVKTLAVVGPNANATTVMQANYQGVAPYLISPLMGLSKYATTTYAEGCDTNCASTTGFAAATQAAQNADATILVIGISTEQEAEGRDRTSIALPGNQEQLIAEVVAASKGPVMVVVMAGGSVDFTVAKTNPKVKGIMWVGYPGQSGGQAIADVVFGKVNPSGRLPHTQYPKQYLDNLSMFDMNMRPGVNNTGRTYRFYTGTPVYAYGSGISYTTFKYSFVSGNGAISQADLAADCQANNNNGVYSVTAGAKVFGTIAIKVENTGTVAGSDAVLAFSKAPAAGTGGAPIKSLIGFEKVHLAPGASTIVYFPLHSMDLSLSNEQGKREPSVGTWQIAFGPDDALLVPVSVQ